MRRLQAMASPFLLKKQHLFEAEAESHFMNEEVRRFLQVGYRWEAHPKSIQYCVILSH